MGNATMDSKRNKICDPCRFRDKHVTADYFCQNCMEYYCKQCRKQHLKFRLTMGHTVQKWKQRWSDLSSKVTKSNINAMHEPDRYGSSRVESDLGLKPSLHSDDDINIKKTIKRSPKRYKFVMDYRHTGNCDPCRIKDEHTAAQYFCQTCVDYFCHQCRDKHLKELISKGHLIKVWKKDQLHYLPVTNFGKDNNYVYDFEGEILETDSSKHSHLTGKCTIRLDSCSIAITEIANHVTFCWPFTCIRKYGSMDDKIFFFESGRRCEAGEGRYVLLTHDAVSLHKNMTNFIRLIEKKTHP